MLIWYSHFGLTCFWFNHFYDELRWHSHDILRWHSACTSMYEFLDSLLMIDVISWCVWTWRLHNETYVSILNDDTCFHKRLEYLHMKSIVWNGNEFSILLRLMNLFYQSCESHENKHDEYFENKWVYHAFGLNDFSWTYFLKSYLIMNIKILKGCYHGIMLDNLFYEIYLSMLTFFLKAKACS